MISADAATSASRTRGRRLADTGGAVYFIVITAALIASADRVATVTMQHPYAMGFCKFALLATFGECLKTRIVDGRWLPPKFIPRVVLWGSLGLWITVAFPFVDGGVRAISTAHLWPAEPAAFWMSAWTNIFGGIGLVMMFTHYWADTMLTEGPLWPWQVLGRPQAARWGKIVILALVLFWTPAHTVTFLLPPTWRILCAAYLGIALGLILSVAAKR